MHKITLNAPFGVTAIQLHNGDEALYLHGENLAGSCFSAKDDSVVFMGERLANVLGIPFQLLTMDAPEAEGWCWNDIVMGLGWGKSITLSNMVVRPVVECCISHVTEEDNLIFSDLSRKLNEDDWILDTDVGYLIRLDARTFPLLELKKKGLSGAARWLIYQCMKRANVSMIHFSQAGDMLEGVATFDW